MKYVYKIDLSIQTFLYKLIEIKERLLLLCESESQFFMAIDLFIY